MVSGRCEREAQREHYQWLLILLPIFGNVLKRTSWLERENVNVNGDSLVSLVSMRLAICINTLKNEARNLPIQEFLGGCFQVTDDVGHLPDKHHF